MTIEERAQRYADAYKGILPDELIESAKLWIMEEFRLVAEDARNEERKRITDLALKLFHEIY